MPTYDNGGGLANRTQVRHAVGNSAQAPPMHQSRRASSPPPWSRSLGLVALLTALAWVVGAVAIVPAGARSPSFPTLKAQRELLREWREDPGSTLTTENPQLAEALGESQYSPATAPSQIHYGRTTFRTMSDGSYPQAFLALTAIRQTEAGKRTNNNWLIIFVRSSARAHWLVQTTVMLPRRPRLARSSAAARPLSRAQAKRLTATPAAAVQAVLAASNSALQDGTTSTLVPDPAWYDTEENWAETIASEAGGFTSHSAHSGYPAYAIREVSGSLLVVLSFTMSNTETEGEGFWLHSAFFPSQLLISQSDTWVWSVAVTDPHRGPKRALSVAGTNFGPEAATATTTTGATLTFGPW